MAENQTIDVGQFLFSLVIGLTLSVLLNMATRPRDEVASTEGGPYG